MSRKIPAYAQRMAEIAGAPEGAPSDSREVHISFSSEARYKRHDWDADEDYWEVLGHDAAEVDLPTDRVAYLQAFNVFRESLFHYFSKDIYKKQLP